MNAKQLLGMVLPIILAVMLNMAGCQADVDLQNIDTKAEVELGVALPVGSMSVTLSDILGSNNLGNLYFRNDGVLCLHYDYYRNEDFHTVNFTDYISKAEQTIYLYDPIHEKMESLRAEYPDLEIPEGYVCGLPDRDFSVKIPTTLSLTYEGINDELSEERIDSAYIVEARFEGYLMKKNLSTPFEWVDSVVLVFGKEYVAKNGNRQKLYDKSTTQGELTYGMHMPIMLEDFSIDLVKDHTKPCSNSNVVNTSSMDVEIYLTVPQKAAPMAIASDMAIIFGMDAQFIQYTALWGMFESSNKMHDEGNFSLDSLFGNLSMLRNLRLPIAEPEINVRVCHELACPLVFKGEYLYVTSRDGQKHYAEFGDSREHTYQYPRDAQEAIRDNAWMDPSPKTIGDSIVLNMVFNNNPEHGRIDQMFLGSPSELAWGFSIDFDKTLTNQTRLTPTTKINMDVDMDLPFIFNEGLYMTYSDTLENINLNLASFSDSISVVDSITQSDMCVQLKIENKLPLDVRIVLCCIDSTGQVIVDDRTGEPLRLTTSDTIFVQAPEYKVDANGQMVISSPGCAEDLLSINKEKFAKVGDVRSLGYAVIIDDKSLHSAFESNDNFKIRITEASQLKLQIGIGAKVGAVLNLTGNQ